MKIGGIEVIHADAGWRTLSFLKITTDEDLVGWSEFSSGASVPGLATVIRAISASLIGCDPRKTNLILASLTATTRMFPGGLIAQAIGAIDNACLDIRAKSLGVPVHDLFGGAIREKLPVYWSQCGTLRTEHSHLLNTPALRTLDDIVELGKEVRRKGYSALKTNILVRSDQGIQNYRPGFRFSPEKSARHAADHIITSTVDLMHAFREGAGDDVGLMLDLNFNFKPEGIRRVARSLEALNLTWLELDLESSRGLSELRKEVRAPIASLEAVLGSRKFHEWLERQAVDIAIVDPQWNGLTESIRMANLADTYDLNVASHNYHGQLSTLIGAHFSSSIANSHFVEYVVDEAPWVDSFYTHPLNIENGSLVLPLRPGWGTDINEEAVQLHPPRSSIL